MLDLSKKHCKIGIINNRIEMHGDKEVTAFDIPLTILLDPAELNELLGDPYKHRALFDTKGDVATPMFPEFDEFTMKHDLEGATSTLHLGPGTYEIEFKGCNVKGLKLAPIHGGETELNCKLQVNPQSKHITKLLDAQNTEVKISIADAKIAEKKKQKQRELPLGADPNADKVDGEQGGEGESTSTPLNGAHVSQPDTTLIWWQHGLTGEQKCGQRCDMPEGCVEIDPPAGGKSEAAQEAASEAKPVDDSAEFAAGVAKALKANVGKSGAIDGRSERVKHKDRQRNRDGAH